MKASPILFPPPPYVQLDIGNGQGTVFLTFSFWELASIFSAFIKPKPPARALYMRETLVKMGV
jgi:hypothetical protein